METAVIHKKFQISSKNLSLKEFNDIIKTPKHDYDFEQMFGEMVDKTAKFEFNNSLFYRIVKNGVNLNLFSKFLIGNKLNAGYDIPTWVSFSYLSCGTLEGCSCSPNKEFVSAAPGISGVYKLEFNDCQSKILPKFRVEVFLEIISFVTLKNKKVLGTKNGIFHFSDDHGNKQMILTDFCLFPSGKYCNNMTGIWRSLDNLKDFVHDFAVERNVSNYIDTMDNPIEPIFEECKKVVMLESSKNISKTSNGLKNHHENVERISARNRR